MTIRATRMKICKRRAQSSLFPALALLVAMGCNSGQASNQETGNERSVSAPGMEVRVGPKVLSDVPQYITTPMVPQELSFAGERIPLDRSDVREALEHELTVNMFRHSRTMVALKHVERWRPLIEKTLQNNGVPADFIYLAVAESELDNTAESYVGAVGMWQFMEPTAKDFGLRIDRDVDMRRDPKLSTEAACRYFKWAYEQFNSWTLVAASYNRGVSGMKNALQDQQAQSFYDLHLNQETARYVYRILAFKLILENPEAYGYFLEPQDRYSPHAFRIEKVEEGDVDLIAFAKKHNTTYKELRILNPWFNNSSSYALRVPKGVVYEVRVPHEQISSSLGQ